MNCLGMHQSPECGACYTVRVTRVWCGSAGLVALGPQNDLWCIRDLGSVLAGDPYQLRRGPSALVRTCVDFTLSRSI